MNESVVKDIIERQRTSFIDSEAYRKLPSKKYSSGKPILPENHIFYGIVYGMNSDGDQTLELIMFHPEELEVLYKFIGWSSSTSCLPKLERI